jgi:hypothetical protein
MHEEGHAAGRHRHHPTWPGAIAPGARLRRRLTSLGLAALLGACGSGGGPSGGGGDGGGNRRQGENGNNLKLTPTFVVRNQHDNPRVETLRVSVPFTKTMVTDLSRVGVRGITTAWQPLQYWPDGSVKIAQAQFTDELGPRETKVYQVVKDVSTLQGPFARNSWVAAVGGSAEIGARVRDTFGTDYSARVALLAAGEVLAESYLVRVTRHRLYHRRASGGIGRDFLTSTFYVTEHRDMPFVTVDWILGNDYLGADDPKGSTDPNLYPLGPVDVNEAQFLVKAVSAAEPYRPEWHAVEGWVAEADGTYAARVMRDTYIDDGQTRRYRFFVRFEHPGAPPDAKQRWLTTWQAFRTEPLHGLADLATWQGTGALGLHGGPIDGPGDAAQRAERDWYSWAGAGHFGTWGSFGEIPNTGQTGTPRNAPISPDLGHAIQAMEPRLLTKLEQMAWIQSVRPYHLYGLTVGAEQAIYLWDAPPVYLGSRDLSPESLGRRAVVRNGTYAAYRVRFPGGHPAHGWGAYDHEHWTTDLLFDYWTVSGDCWAREELRQLGESLKGVMRLKQYFTAFQQPMRAEGWTMVGFVQCWLATRDDSIKQYALRRIQEVNAPQRMSAHASKAFYFQPTYAGTGYGPDHKFIYSYQCAAVVYGMLAAHRFFESDLALTFAEETVTTLEYAWVKNYNDPQFGFVANGFRYMVPVEVNGQPVPADHFDKVAGVGVKWGDSPLGGAHTFHISAMHLLYERARSDALAVRALAIGRTITGGRFDDNARWNKWCLAVNEELVEP